MLSIPLGLLVTRPMAHAPQLQAVRSERDIDIVFESYHPEALPHAASLSRAPAVLLVDMYMEPGIRRVVGRVRRHYGHVPIVVLDRKGNAIRAQRARNVGVAAVLTLRSRPERFVARLIAIGLRHMNRQKGKGRSAPLLYDPLTPREWDILHYVAHRFNAREIAEQLGLSYATVRTHIRNIYAKGGIGSRAEAGQLYEALLVKEKKGYNGVKEVSKRMDYVDVMVEPTPNPDAFKFTLDRAVTEGGSLSFANAQQAADHPLAEKLFALEGVRAVFFLNNFVTITREPARDWNALATEVVNVIQEHFENP